MTTFAIIFITASTVSLITAALNIIVHIYNIVIIKHNKEVTQQERYIIKLLFENDSLRDKIKELQGGNE